MGAKKKRKSRAVRRKNAQAEEAEEAEEEKQPEQASATNDDEDVDMVDWGSELEKSDDEAPVARIRRYKRPNIDDWAQEIIQDLIKRKGRSIKTELHSETPDFSKIEKAFQKANQKIQNANGQNNVSVERNLITETAYQITYDTWLAKLPSVQDNPEKGWQAYDGLYSAFSMINHQHHLPDDWNIPPDVTVQEFGERPKDMKKPGDTDDSDSAVEFSDESESEESDSDEEGIDALESKMRKEYTALSRGKALYWWRVGTGTQVFVRYGSKRNPIYRVRAGSSEPYDPRTTELVLTNTRGNSKSTLDKNNSIYQEFVGTPMFQQGSWKVGEDEGWW